MPQITIDHDLCTLCRVCVRSCPVEILYIEPVNGKRCLSITSSHKCLECRACETLCPHNAIYVDPSPQEVLIIK